MSEHLTGLRKSAIVLLSIGSQQAEEVLRCVGDDVAGDLRREMQSALIATPTARAMALRSFIEAVDTAREEAPSAAAVSGPFASLHDAETQTLFESIRDEHPQTIALVLAHLRPDKSGEILAGLSPEKQVDVIKRIAEIKQTSNQVIDQVEHGVRERLGAIVEGAMRGGGVSAVAEILNSADRRTEREILHTLQSDSPQLVEQIRRTQAVFEDLLCARDRDMQLVLEQLDIETISFALRTARERLVRKVLRNLPHHEATSIERELQSVEAVRIDDIESAQQRVAEIVERLNTTGEISVHGKKPRGPQSQRDGDERHEV